MERFIKDTEEFRRTAREQADAWGAAHADAFYFKAMVAAGLPPEPPRAVMEERGQQTFTRADLAEEFDCSPKTITRKVSEFGIREKPRIDKTETVVYTLREVRKLRAAMKK